MTELHTTSGPLLGTLARALGCTEGQLYTIATGVTMAAVLALSSVHGAPPAGADAAIPAPVATVSPAPAAVTVPPAQLQPPLSPGIEQPPPPTTSVVTGPTPIAPPPAKEVSGLRRGQVVALARIAGPNAVSGVAVADDGTAWVTTRVGTTTSGASRLIGVSNTGLLLQSLVLSGQLRGHPHNFSGVTTLPDGSVLVLDEDDARVLRIDPRIGAQSVLTKIPDVPACVFALAPTPCEPGVADHVPHPSSIVPGPRGTLLVSDPSQDTIWTWHSGASVAPLYQSSYDVQGDGPTGLARADGVLLFTVGATLDPASPGGGALYRMPLPEQGAAGTPVLKAGFSRDDRPGSVATGVDGLAYVVLRGTASILTVDGHGVVQPLFLSAANGMKVDGPTYLALASGRLLVTNQPPATTRRSGELLAIGVPDAPYNDRD